MRGFLEINFCCRSLIKCSNIRKILRAIPKMDDGRTIVTKGKRS